MHEIAERAGVGKATVSLALRDDPRLRPETRRRIQKLAAKMGYRTNATVANLMAQLRASRSAKYQATIGLLNASADPNALSGLRTFRDWVAGCRDRADQLGYGIEEFWLQAPGATAARHAAMIESRSIRGLVVAGLSSPGGLADRFDPLWRRFACIGVGLRFASPALNFSSNDQFSTALHAVQHLWAYGYRRMGFVLDPRLDAIVDRRFSGGFWAGQEGLDGSERIPMLPFDPMAEEGFRAWYARHQPDVILTLHPEVKTWLETMGIKIPGEVGLVHLDRNDELSQWTGMEQNNRLVGAAAIDMLIGQLHRNEVGIPASPKASFIQSHWVDGPTTFHKAARCARPAPPSREKALA